ncbi:hypothetical protein [Chitinophaga sancti]|uniref:Uncharacterized protein n=1 Tax=Chitinophaga sancti TaxID=1004 RepID=A0A1K1T1D2_9BACT|nr:hypothetical protein [Chitinophaga sancti]WQD61000.1 hypothetical protein U0033_24175 [Chitinophaga sancti]WQG86873.1 hypothetical protein SR876_18300 [Chitinophaga sancti]SFW90378.1 hypothetical protein SAMN05661012_06602 [Chitinophaga sancti]
MEEQELFHITCNEYPSGFIVPLPDHTLYHQEAIAKGTAWIDNYLDDFRPINAPSRSRTFYAFGSIQHCLSFYSSRICAIGSKRIYKVHMVSPYPAPMCLTDGLKKNGEGHVINQDIAIEYWCPRNEWRVLEYLSEIMQIHEDVTASINGLPQFGNFFYGEDQKLRTKLFNC